MQKHISALLVAAGSVSLLVGIAAPGSVHADAPEPVYSVQETSNVQYGPLPDEVLDLYQPAGKTGGSTAFVFIHGGAWTSGSKTEHTDTSTGSRRAGMSSRASTIASCRER